MFASWISLKTQFIQTYQQLQAEIRQFYFENWTNNITYDQYVPLLSDINFVYHATKAAKTHALKSTNKAYFYQ